MKLLAVESFEQPRPQAGPLLGQVTHLLGVERRPVATGALRRVHRAIGSVNEFLSLGAISGIDRHSHAYRGRRGGEAELRMFLLDSSPELIWRHHGLDASDEVSRAGFAGRGVQGDHQEFIAAESGDRVAGSGNGAQTLANAAEQFVPRGGTDGHEEWAVIVVGFRVRFGDDPTRAPALSGNFGFRRCR